MRRGSTCQQTRVAQLHYRQRQRPQNQHPKAESLSRLTILERDTRCPRGDRSCRARTVADAGKLGAVPTVDSRY